MYLKYWGESFNKKGVIINMKYIFSSIIIAIILGFIVNLGIQSGSIHLYFSNNTEETVKEEESYSKYSSGDIRFNIDEQDSLYSIPITINNDSSKLYAYADRKSFTFLNNRPIAIYLFDDDMNYLDGCLVTSDELCNFESTFSAGDYLVQFSSHDKHTWELWVKVE